MCDPRQAPQLPRSEAWLPGRMDTEGQGGRRGRTKPDGQGSSLCPRCYGHPKPRPGQRVETVKDEPAFQSPSRGSPFGGAELRRGPRKGAGSLSSRADSGRPHGAGVPAETLGRLSGCRGPLYRDLRPSCRSSQPHLSVFPWGLVTRVGVIRGFPCFVLIIFSPKGVFARVTHHSLRASWSLGTDRDRALVPDRPCRRLPATEQRGGQWVKRPCTARPTPLRNRLGPGGRGWPRGTQAAAPTLTVEAEGAAVPLQQGWVGAGHRRAGDLVANGFKFLQVKQGAHVRPLEKYSSVPGTSRAPEHPQ